MKYIKLFNESNNIDTLCIEYGIKNYTINPDNSIDVKGDVNLFDMELDNLSITFNKVSGYFTCASNNLTSLKGCPKYVGGNFYFGKDNGKSITTLEYYPEHVSSRFIISDCPIK